MSIPTVRWSVGVCVLAALVLAAPHAQADIRFEANALRDTTIFQNNPNNSLGGGDRIYAGNNRDAGAPLGYTRRGLIAFDLKAIPVGSTVNSVTLELVLAQVSGGETSATRNIGLHTLLGDWDEGAINAGSGQGSLAGPGDATWWYRFYNTEEWTSTGGDFTSSASATVVVGRDLNSKYTWLSTPTLVADVQGWVNKPSSNFGWLLKGDENEKGTFRCFWSKEAHVTDPLYASYEPKLVIDYTAVPEPSSLILFAGGAVAVLVVIRRGRRRS